MPAFKTTLDDTQIWQVAMFLKKMDHLPEHIAQAWQATPSAGGARSPALRKMMMK